VLLVALLAACDSTQPLEADQKMAQISFQGASALTRTYNVWDMYEDADGDTLPDDLDGDGVGDLYLFCQDIGVGSQALTPASVPWRFSVEVSIIRAGTTVPEVLTQEAALLIDANLADYDTAVQFNLTAPKNPITVTDGMATRTFLFDNDASFGLGPRRLTAANRDVVLALENPLTTINPVTYGQGRGLCSNGDPGPAVVDGGSPPFEVVLGKGDTIIVEARRGESAPEMVYVNPDTGVTTSLFSPQPELSGTLVIDGRVAEVNGTVTTAGLTVGSPISYTYTIR
jgi:hypothetical protein